MFNVRNMLRYAIRGVSALSQPCLQRSRSYTFFLRAATRQRADEPGQFGLSGLHSASDWPRIAQACIDDCLQLADRIRTHPRASSPELLHTFDDLSDRLCSVLDVAELCRNVHPDSDFTREADKAFWQVSSVMQELNADYELYRPLDELYDDHLHAVKKGFERHGFLSEEDVAMVESLKSDFETGGIRLDAKQKERLIALQVRVSSLSSDFVSSPLSHAPTLDLPESKLRHIPASIRRQFRASAQPYHFCVPIDGPTSQILLKWVPDTRVREQVFKLAHNHDAQFKLATLDSLLQGRREIANILGEPSYAKLLFNGRIASSPDDVLEFLRQLSHFVKETAHQEKNQIEIEKMRAEPYATEAGQVKVHGWDRSYYIGRLKADNFDLSSVEVSKYLPLSACLRGLGDVVRHIFGIKMVAVKPNNGEIWHDDVEKIELTDCTGAVLGHIFLDLFPREGKYDHAAHFAIRCGRQSSLQEDYQTPVVALVCNFGHNSRREDRLLTISEYETLFHEFGHSLHSILSRTKYQHLSGTRVATDFVEVPSHLFEHFAWDPRILSRFARHHQTGDPMPTRMLKSLCASRRGFVATDLQMQLLFSAMDLRFHSATPPVGLTVNAFETLQSEFTSYPPDKGVSIPATFHHFVGYGAGYYSYIFARVISAQLWSALFEDNPLSSTGGARLWKDLLIHGGARDPARLICDLLNHDLSCAPFWRSTGIDVNKCRVNIKIPLVEAQ